jgi:serine/threonine protein kinase
MKRRADITCGTQSYMAPEIVHSAKTYSKSVDIWAIGIIMHMVLTGGTHPLAEPNKSKKE